ncbi:hypothetical protein BGZ57DRAFT_854837 [Hyaloscypha finlandica]|nr:hypothetical protein BGZ57DRAFT_854837 [Hyaloscypha finlandica]
MASHNVAAVRKTGLGVLNAPRRFNQPLDEGFWWLVLDLVLDLDLDLVLAMAAIVVLALLALLAVVEPDLGPKFWHLGGAFAHLSLFAGQTLNLISERGRSEHTVISETENMICIEGRACADDWMRVCDFMYVPTAVDRRCWQMSVDPPGSEEINDRNVKSGELALTPLLQKTLDISDELQQTHHRKCCVLSPGGIAAQSSKRSLPTCLQLACIVPV